MQGTHPRTDIEAARRTAAEAGVPQRVIPVDELAELPEIRQNPPDRCYLCKKLLFRKALEEAKRLGASAVVEGTNADDLGQYRPGIRAVRELGIQSPLADAGFTKAQVRRFAGELGIAAAERPSSPCMATRLPYGTRIREEVLKRLEQAENALRDLGYAQVRARLHGDVLRLEVEPGDIPRAAGEAEKILQILTELEFRYVTLDLEGFRSGSMDREITPSVL